MLLFGTYPQYASQHLQAAGESEANLAEVLKAGLEETSWELDVFIAASLNSS